jgi:hypothetical protein
VFRADRRHQTLDASSNPAARRPGWRGFPALRARSLRWNPLNPHDNPRGQHPGREPRQLHGRCGRSIVTRDSALERDADCNSSDPGAFTSGAPERRLSAAAAGLTMPTASGDLLATFAREGQPEHFQIDQDGDKALKGAHRVAGYGRTPCRRLSDQRRQRTGSIAAPMSVTPRRRFPVTPKIGFPTFWLLRCESIVHRLVHGDIFIDLGAIDRHMPELHQAVTRGSKPLAEFRDRTETRCIKLIQRFRARPHIASGPREKQSILHLSVENWFARYRCSHGMINDILPL